MSWKDARFDLGLLALLAMLIVATVMFITYLAEK